MTEHERFAERRFRLAHSVAELTAGLHRGRTAADLGFGPIELEALAQLCDEHELPETARTVRALLPSVDVVH